MKRGIVFVAVMLLLVACASPLMQNNAPKTNSDALEKIVREYANWTPLFETPRNVSFFLMALCRLQTRAEESYLQSEHAQYFVQVFVNPTGSGMVMQAGARTFPEGTVIVKEKWARDERFLKNESETKPAGLGIMLKEKSGWQYAYVDEAGNITRDQKQLEHCAACHSAQAERDSVFYPEVLSQ